MKFALPLVCIGALALSACCNVKEGRVVSKGARLGLPTVYTSAGLNSLLGPGRDPLYRAPFPDRYWIEVEGQDNQGRYVRCDVFLFRNEWTHIKVGDHWSKSGGVSSDKEVKKPDFKTTASLRTQRHAPRKLAAQRQLPRRVETATRRKTLRSARHTRIGAVQRLGHVTRRGFAERQNGVTRPVAPRARKQPLSAQLFRARVLQRTDSPV